MSEKAKVTAKTPETKRENTVSQTRKTDISQSINSPIDHILHLQKTIGNQAVKRLIKSGTLQAKFMDSYPQNIEAPLSVYPQLLHSQGQPLDLSTRSSMESQFDYDLSHVRIHTNKQASESAQLIGAKAYTVGQNIVFRKEQYAPTTDKGHKLLTHELTHVVQQAHGITGSEQVLESQADAQKNYNSSFCLNTSTEERNPITRLQLKPDRITAITVNLANSTVTISLDDGSTISGPVTNTNLVSGDYQARWDRSTNGLEISPWPTREEVIYFEVSGTRPFLRRYDRLRRAITTQIPFRVVSQPPVQAPAVAQPAQTTRGPGTVSLTLEEAMRRCEANNLSGIKVFPFRGTRFGAAPIMARRDGDDIVVEQPVYVLANDDFRQQTRTLPTETFISGVRLRPNEIVRVHVYEPRWYHLNITGSTEGDIEHEFCVTGEQMLEIAEASTTATLFNIGLTVVDAATLFIPVGRGVSAISQPLQRAGRTGLTAAMIGTAEVVAPRTLAATAERAAITVVEEQATTQVVGRALARTVSQTVVRTAEHGLVEAAPRAAAAAAPRLGTGAVAHIAGTGALEAGVETAGGAIRSAVTPSGSGGLTTTPPGTRIPGTPTPTPPTPSSGSGVMLTTVTGDRIIVDTNIASNSR